MSAKVIEMRNSKIIVRTTLLELKVEFCRLEKI